MKSRFLEIFRRIWADVIQYKWGVIIFILYNIIVRKIFKAFCPSLILIGLPCAGCGLTRAVFYIITGRIKRGMMLNPSAPFWIITIIYFAICRYIVGRKGKGIYILLSVTCVVTIAIYVYRMIYMFPGDPPMVYYRRNILAKIVKNIRK